MGSICSKENPQKAEPERSNPQSVIDPVFNEKPKEKKHRFSLFRVTSKRSPNSNKRASNYNHVHDAVNKNFETASRGSDRQRPLGVSGLENLGNTCFMNSSLQCLSATIPLTDYFLGYDYQREINKQNFLGTGGKLVNAYAELMKDLWLNPTISSLRPLSFKRTIESFAPQFEGCQQHDAQEFLSFLLDFIHEDLNRIKKKPYIEDRDFDGDNDEADAMESWKNYLARDKSLIVDIFQGQLRNTCRCLECGHKNIRFEPFMYLSLPFTEACNTLDNCLDLYLQQEYLTGDNQWFCEKCKTHRDATKKTDLWILPPILIIHLKRFRFNEFGQIGSKNKRPLNYPIADFDLSSKMIRKGTEDPLYDLYGVSNHVGGLGGGHYTAYTLNRLNDHWYEFNDSHCRPISPETLERNSASAYLLFYNRTQRTESGHPSNRSPMVRRQSVSRPDLWPHMQVKDNSFRGFTRRSNRNLSVCIHSDDSKANTAATSSVEVSVEF